MEDVEKDSCILLGLIPFGVKIFGQLAISAPLFFYLCTL